MRLTPSDRIGEILERAAPVGKEAELPFSILRAGLPGLLIVSAVLIPFWNKAFTIDDYIFLREAQQVLVDPLHPSAFDIVWDKDVPVDATNGIWISGPVTAYLLVPVILAGAREWIAHLIWAILLSAAVLGTVALAKRLGFDERVGARTGALLASTPAVLGMASTNMPDIPTLTFGVIGVERYLAWVESRRRSFGAAAALFLALAFLSRTYSVLLAVVAVLFAIRRRRDLAPLIVALGLAVAVFLAMSGGGAGPTEHLEFVRSVTQIWSIGSNLLAFGINWTLALPFALPWLLLRAANPVNRSRTALAGLTASAVVLLGDWRYAIALLGYAAVADVLVGCWDESRTTRLALGVWLLLPGVTVIYIHTPPKYHVVAAPAAALLVAQLSVRTALGAWVVRSSVCAGVVFAILIIHADAQASNHSRTAVDEIIKPRIAAGQRVWFVGHWGFQWYAEEAGARIVTLSPPYPEPGAFVLSSSLDGCPVLAELTGKHLIHRRVHDDPGGRVMSRPDGVGFYSNFWGPLPWSWSCRELCRFELWRME